MAPIIPAAFSRRALWMLVLWCALPTITLAETPAPESKPPLPDDRRFLDDRERGWFWRELDPEPDALQTDPPPKPAAPAAPSQPQPEGPPPLSVAWLKVELEKARIAAIDDPSHDNVEWHSFLLRLSMDRAKKFTESAIEVNASNPWLDGSAAREQTSYGRLQQQSEMLDQRRELVKRVAGELGIWYFYAQSCDYCARANAPIAEFASAYDIPVLAISMDGGAPRDGYWPDFVVDQGQAAHLRVKQTPTLYLYRPPDQLILLNVGVQTMPGLEKKLLRIAEAEGWITPEEKRFAVRGLRGKYLIDAVGEISTSIDWNNREDALEALREASEFGVEHARTGEMNIMEEGQ